MSDQFEALPEEIQQGVLSLVQLKEDGTWECPDRRALIEFIVENAEPYPGLLNLVRIDEERMMEHVRETGEVSPGIKIIKTTTTEGDNVTQLRVFPGPTTIPEDERS